jgi:hypothetical protein
MKVYLVESLRVDPSALARLNPADLRRFADRYRSRKVRLAADAVERLQSAEEGAGP